MGVAGLEDGDTVGHEEEEEEGLDHDRGLWAGEGGAAAGGGWVAHVDVMAAKGCVHELKEVQGVWEG